MARARAFAGHLLVDGYNVIHQWSDLARTLEAFGVEAAQAGLDDYLRPVHDIANYRVTIVYDGKGSRPQIERPHLDLTFSHVFTPTGMTADALMEQLVATAKKPLDLIVATRDNLLCETVFANGGRTLSPDALLDWCRDCAARARALVDESNRAARGKWRNGGRLGDKMPFPRD